MEINDLIARLAHVTQCGGQYSARCPAHDDGINSLSLSLGEDGRILLHCHAGCAVDDIVHSLGLELKDLFPAPVMMDPLRGIKPVAEYFYGAELKKVRTMSADGSKSFYWMHNFGGMWEKGRRGIVPPLYKGHAKELPEFGTVYIVEGEKDVLSMEKMGFTAVSLPDGANSKWHESFSDELRGRNIIVVPDNDTPGRSHAENIARQLVSVADTVKVLDLRAAWADIPEHYDVTDIIERRGVEFFRIILADLCESTPDYAQISSKDSAMDSFLSLFRPLSEFEEVEPQWLIEGWIPANQITIVSGDGGVGKSKALIEVVAALSTGKPTFLDPTPAHRDPMRVAVLTKEEGISAQIKRKIRQAGGDMLKIIAPDYLNDKTGELKDFNLGSKKMEYFLQSFQPEVVVLDPIQDFIPSDINMGSRNAMRHCMSPMATLAEELGTTVILIVHTNKSKAVYGRSRISDSADLWDIARSVIMLGTTTDGNINYISNEKNNNAPLADTILFSFDPQGRIVIKGTTQLRDRDYVLNAFSTPTTKRGACADWITDYLKQHDGEVMCAELDRTALAAGYSNSTLRRAKDTLKAQRTIYYQQRGNKKEKVWFVCLSNPVFTELNDSLPTPFDDE